MRESLPIVNLHEAKFECIYGRGCEGLCCQNGRPGVSVSEQRRIEDNLDRFLPHVRPEARAVIEKQGFLSGRKKMGEPMVRVVRGWCVFFNQGCVLHKVGAEEGDKYRYKPMRCALFPLDRDEKGTWSVRQQGYRGEAWDLFCLEPEASPRLAADTLCEEVAMGCVYEQELTGMDLSG
jgi:Protein of unknown function (DUF3109)